MANDKFRSAFTVAHLIMSATVSVKAGQYNKLGEYAITAGELVSPGWGGLNGQDNADGRLYINMMDNSGTPAEINGIIRLHVYSPQDRPMEIISEWRTEQLRTSATDRTLQIPFPEYSKWVSEDRKIVLEYKPDADQTVSKANTTIIMDITKAVV